VAAALELVDPPGCRNSIQGDGTFLDVSQSAGIAPHPGTGMGLVACDYDEDGDMDIFVLNDVAQNFLFRNDGKGYFEEVAILSGTAFNVYGDELGSMGVDCGDFDGDGDLDFYMTSYQGEFIKLIDTVDLEGGPGTSFCSL
jgi:hypothetical protein